MNKIAVLLNKAGDYVDNVRPRWFVLGAICIIVANFLFPTQWAYFESGGRRVHRITGATQWYAPLHGWTNDERVQIDDYLKIGRDVSSKP
jgi:hypothetical protein